MKIIGEVRTGSRRQTLLGLCLLIVLALPGAAAWGAGDGHIDSLDASGASPPGGCIDISATGHAEGSIVNSNLFYQLYAPGGGAPIATRSVALPSMNAGDTWSDSWSYCNPPRTGNYRVRLRWSPGNSQNGNIDEAETEFYSVPTLGWVLGTAALALLGAFIYRRRADFVQVAQ